MGIGNPFPGSQPLPPPPLEPPFPVKDSAYLPLQPFRTKEEYAKFTINFWKKDCILLEPKQRKTSERVVWRGVGFALDLVRKVHTDERKSAENGVNIGDETAAIFLYCTSLVPSESLFIRYTLYKVDNPRHSLGCTEFKRMKMDFKKGNGSANFFGCKWDTFLRECFDKDGKVSLCLSFAAVS